MFSGNHNERVGICEKAIHLSIAMSTQRDLVREVPAVCDSHDMFSIIQNFG